MFNFFSLKFAQEEKVKLIILDSLRVTRKKRYCLWISYYKMKIDFFNKTFNIYDNAAVNVH